MRRDVVKREGAYLVQEGVTRPREEVRKNVGIPRITPIASGRCLRTPPARTGDHCLRRWSSGLR